MINEDKLRLLTKTAVIEKNSQEQFNINRYFKKDYVVYHILLIWVCISIAYFAAVFGVAAYLIEEIPETVQDMNFGIVAFTLLMIYIIVVIVYAIISMLVYNKRYDNAMTDIKKYNSLLKLIEKEYEKEESLKKAADTQKEVSSDTLVKKKSAVRRKGDKA